MTANYHTHTYRCGHASGTDEEYIQKAIAEGINILGFADHAPYIYPNGYKSNYKMTPEEASGYISSLTALREKYRDKIEILIGFEAEYYRSLWDKTLDFWHSLGAVDYLILGQHFTGEEYPRESATHGFNGCDKSESVTEYVNTVISAIKTGRFTYVAHPDVINYRGGDLDFFRSEMKKIGEAAVKYNIPLEINLLGLSTGRNYPNPIFWESVSALSPRIILGCDAHEPIRVADKNEIINAKRFADKYKLDLIDKVDIIDPFKI